MFDPEYDGVLAGQRRAEQQRTAAVNRAVGKKRPGGRRAMAATLRTMAERLDPPASVQQGREAEA